MRERGKSDMSRDSRHVPHQTEPPLSVTGCGLLTVVSARETRAGLASVEGVDTG